MLKYNKIKLKYNNIKLKYNKILLKYNNLTVKQQCRWAHLILLHLSLATSTILPIKCLSQMSKALSWKHVLGETASCNEVIEMNSTCLFSTDGTTPTNDVPSASAMRIYSFSKLCLTFWYYSISLLVKAAALGYWWANKFLTSDI